MRRQAETEARRPHRLVRRCACQNSLREHRDNSAQTRRTLALPCLMKGEEVARKSPFRSLAMQGNNDIFWKVALTSIRKQPRRKTKKNGDEGATKIDKEGEKSTRRKVGVT